ncbi:hypothetical protein B0H16DRAFT_1571125 [Mycena metata]|uniref:Secreted protein n=1 Tax=Mycena metata TaxID=1033252 RepID=A0AAD7MYY2_9AGAR|nr:hypothetical protein B0H16DRAFT_1571125 [Mycena metata]
MLLAVAVHLSRAWVWMSRWWSAAQTMWRLWTPASDGGAARVHMHLTYDFFSSIKSLLTFVYMPFNDTSPILSRGE